MGRFSCGSLKIKKGRDFWSRPFSGNKKAVGSGKRSPRLQIDSMHAFLAVDKPLPMAVLPPPVSQAVKFVRHFPATPLLN
jgi:hypothetical protein